MRKYTAPAEPGFARQGNRWIRERSWLERARLQSFHKCHVINAPLAAGGMVFEVLASHSAVFRSLFVP